MKGIGEALKEKITELAQTGRLVYLEKLRKEFPETLFDLLKVQGLDQESKSSLRQTRDQIVATAGKGMQGEPTLEARGFGERLKKKF